MFGKEGVITIKTGFTNAAGFCITMLVNCENKLYSLTVLGARTKQERKIIVEKSLQMINQV
jgi:D-alanyl-D-alanine carboxypeptidase